MHGLCLSRQQVDVLFDKSLHLLDYPADNILAFSKAAEMATLQNGLFLALLSGSWTLSK